MTHNDWQTGYARSLTVFLNGDAITEPGPRGDTVRDDSFLLLFNANREPVTFTLPGGRFGPGWDVVISTATAVGAAAPDAAGAITVRPGQSIELAGRSIMVLRGAEDVPAGPGEPA